MSELHKSSSVREIIAFMIGLLNLLDYISYFHTSSYLCLWRESRWVSSLQRGLNRDRSKPGRLIRVNDVDNPNSILAERKLGSISPSTSVSQEKSMHQISSAS